MPEDPSRRRGGAAPHGEPHRPLAVQLLLLYNRLFHWRRRRESYSGWHAPLLDLESQLRYSKWRQATTGESVRHLQPIEIEGRTVLDFGVGRGGPAVWMAEQGARRVVGVDIDDFFLEVSRRYVERVDPQARLPIEILRSEPSRVPLADASVDAILCLRTFERVADPEAVLCEWHRLLVTGGLAYVSFGPLWYHPHGIHLWEIFPAPWVTLLFPERAVVHARHLLKGEVERIGREATYEDLSFNRMTVGRFRRTVRRSPLELERFRLHTALGLDLLGRLPFLRELFASQIDCVLRKRA